MKKMFSHLNLLLILLLLGLSTGCASSTPTVVPTSTPAPVNGAIGIGDPYFPELGNGGYDVQKYVIALDVDPPTNTIKGSTTINAIATQSLLSFNLDFQGLTIDSITVDDLSASYSRTERELTITPSKPLGMNDPFTVVVEYHGKPELVTPNNK
jgi:hypothetical protein